MNLPDYGIAIGNPADIVALACSNEVAAIAELASPFIGFKRGRMTFEGRRDQLAKGLIETHCSCKRVASII